MLYVLFIVLAIAYNWRKFRKERTVFFQSLIDANSPSYRHMILSHHFYVFVFEGFLAVLVAHIVHDKSYDLGILGLGVVYVVLLFFGFFLYQYFIGYLERHTGLTLKESFRHHVVKELRVSFALIMLPVLIYAIINSTLVGSVQEDWGSLWFIGLLLNILLVSVLTIICSVIIMLKLIPNREVSEPEYLEIINKRLNQIGMPNMRVRWIESDIKNAFIMGLKLLSFNNQTMFLGRTLRTILTLEEFDAVIAHELSHVANRHIQKRVIDLLKNFLSILFGLVVIMLVTFAVSMFIWGNDAHLYSKASVYVMVGASFFWFLINYIILFDTIRSQEFEADAYAVIKMGASFQGLSSALEKLSTPEEMPEYLRAKHKVESTNPLVTLTKRLFSTHPPVPNRLSFLRHKIHNNLPFNYYISSAQIMRKRLVALFNWKVSVPIALGMVSFLSWQVYSFSDGQKLITFIEASSPDQIKANSAVQAKINAYPSLIGRTLMYYVVKKKDTALIEHFLNKGANKGHTLVYMLQLSDDQLFKQFYASYDSHLTEEEYFLLLRTTAQLNNTEGYRHLVNSKHFTALDPAHKEDVSKVYERSQKIRERSPASIK